MYVILTSLGCDYAPSCMIGTPSISPITDHSLPVLPSIQSNAKPRISQILRSHVSSATKHGSRESRLQAPTPYKPTPPPTPPSPKGILSKMLVQLQYPVSTMPARHLKQATLYASSALPLEPSCRSPNLEERAEGPRSPPGKPCTHAHPRGFP